MRAERNQRARLPAGWIWTELGQVVEDVRKVSPSSSDPDAEFAYIDISSIDNRSKRIVSPKQYSWQKAPSRARQIVQAGDILFSTVRTYLKNLAIVSPAHDKQIASTGFCVIRPHELVENKLVFYWVQTGDFLTPLTRCQRGTSYPAVRNSDVFDQPIPLPPQGEQRRIVAKIEELFARLDAGVDALKKAKAQLKRYRQAVLKAAFSGQLTADWRGSQQTASEGLALFSDLPKGWSHVAVNDLGEIVTGTTPSKKKPEYYGTDYPFFKPADLNAGYYVRNSGDSLSKEGIEQARLLPERSVLVTCIGATIGKTGFTRVRGASNQQINSIIPESEIVLPEYVYFLLTSPQIQTAILSTASSTTLPILNKSKFGAMRVPLAPLEEQVVVVEEIERRFSIADGVGLTLEDGLIMGDRLRQSILAQAFEGTLVHQDPSDEPACRLLERIRQERAKQKIATKSRRGPWKGIPRKRRRSGAK